MNGEVQNGIVNTIVADWGPEGAMLIVFAATIYFMFRWYEKSRIRDLERYEVARAADLVRFETNVEAQRSAHKDERDVWRTEIERQHTELAVLFSQQIELAKEANTTMLKFTATMAELRGLVAAMTGKGYSKQ